MGLQGGFIVSHRRSALFLLDTGTPGTNNKDKVRSQGHSVIYYTERVHPRLKILPLMYRQVSARRSKSIEKGYKFLIMGTRFCKKF